MSARSQDTPVAWVPISQLSPLARALLGDLGDRDVVPGHVADRVTALARQWAASGFTDRTVHLWEDLQPADAALLNNRGVDPALLDRPVGRSATTFRRAIAAGKLSAADAADRLMKAAGEEAPGAAPKGAAAPTNAAAPKDNEPEEPKESGPASSGLFSHQIGDYPDNTPTGQRPKPTHTPFST